MRRRQYLAVAGLGLPLAGYGSSGSGEAQTGERETNEAENGEPDVAFGEPELVVEEGGISTDVYVAVDVENVGDGPSGWVTLDVRWFNEAGDFVGDRTHRLYTLGAGETWAARVHHLGSGAEEVADFEFEGEFEAELPSSPPDGVELIESELQVGDRSADILGRVENGTGTELSYLQAIGKIYDADGVVLGSERTNETDIPADTTWSFDMSWRGRDRVPLAEDYEIVLTDAPF